MADFFDRESERIGIIESARALRNSHPDIPVFLTYSEVAKVLYCSERTVKKKVDGRELKPFKNFGRLMFDFDEVLDHAKKRS